MLGEEAGNGPDAEDSGMAENTSGTFARRNTYENDTRAKEFLSTERTGRRNALTLEELVDQTGATDLPDRFEKLTTETDQSGNRRQDPNSPSTSDQQGRHNAELSFVSTPTTTSTL